MQTIEIFWTGGFDSTFRVVQLSRYPIMLQPVYITGIASDVRKNEYYELRAIKQITALLKEKPETKAEILPLKIVGNHIEDKVEKDPDFVYEMLPHDHSVAVAFRRIYVSLLAPRRSQLSTKRGSMNAANLDVYISSQYQWLAMYANSRDNPVEVGITAGYVNKFLGAIGGSNAVEEIDYDGIKQYVLSEKKCQSPDGFKVFGNFAFSFYNAPQKREIVDEYKRMGCEDVMDLTWFCFDPIDGMPCGQCWTCVHTYRDGITNRFTPEALERYHRREEELARSSDSGVNRSIEGFPSSLGGGVIYPPNKRLSAKFSRHGLIAIASIFHNVNKDENRRAA